MISTPETSHLDFETVYEPAEDSFLLLDALELDLKDIRDRLRPALCLELGCGSGVISTALCSSLGGSCFFLCCDLNEKACRATLSTAARNDAPHRLDAVCSDMLSGLDLASKVDLLVCNPPYVATTDLERRQGLREKAIAASWAGGERGTSMTSSLIRMLPKLLSTGGVAYVVLEQCNKPESVAELARALALETATVIERRAGREVLSVLKLTPRPND